jgi:hypothetical protein
MKNDPELLIGLGIGELEALAGGLLVPSAQGRLDELLARKQEQKLSADEETELDRLLPKVDQLTILKRRASTLCIKLRYKPQGHEGLHSCPTSTAGS